MRFNILNSTTYFLCKLWRTTQAKAQNQHCCIWSSVCLFHRNTPNLTWLIVLITLKIYFGNMICKKRIHTSFELVRYGETAMLFAIQLDKVCVRLLIQDKGNRLWKPNLAFFLICISSYKRSPCPLWAYVLQLYF